ncbi:HD domain-containing protein [Halovivax cerinus]|uniref:HD domain-containing protein n=1 Tax=Halovivax cerinus TaxID=1487865 RepID=A0ABD5NMQ4_9EURY|nr:HD domain-containing protein [Halovivax cerinus]
MGEKLAPESTESSDVRSIARTYFADAPPAHDWLHVRRVERLAEQLAAGRDDVDDSVLRYAVWLHDVGRQREDAGAIDDHANWGAREAESILESIGLDRETIDAVAHCIRAHRFSNDVEPRSPEARILCDADNLDAIGAVGIARVFSHGGSNGFPMHGIEPSTDGNDKSAGAPSRTHFTEKILTLSDRMYTDAGRDLAAERHAFCERFLERFDRESTGAV